MKDLEAPKLGGYKYTLPENSISKTGLAISDLLLAYKIEPAVEESKFIRHGLNVIPNPSRAFQKSEIVYLYYELYRLKLDEKQTRYRVEQTASVLGGQGGFFSKIFGVFGGSKRQTVSIQAEHEGDKTEAFEYTAFDFSEFKSGDIELKIRSDRFEFGPGF